MALSLLFFNGVILVKVIKAREFLSTHMQMCTHDNMTLVVEFFRTSDILRCYNKVDVVMTWMCVWDAMCVGAQTAQAGPGVL